MRVPPQGLPGGESADDGERRTRAPGEVLVGLRELFSAFVGLCEGRMDGEGVSQVGTSEADTPGIDDRDQVSFDP